MASTRYSGAGEAPKWLSFGPFGQLAGSVHDVGTGDSGAPAQGGYHRGGGDTRSGTPLFQKNLDAFPNQYIPNESLADALWFMGDKETPILMFEAWLERNPDHAMARRCLTNLRAGG